MAIDYVIDYGCVPKTRLGTNGIVERLKGRARAEAVIQLFREHGDERPPREMGFEMARNTPAGEEASQIIVVQDLLDAARELEPLAQYCADCPANALGEPFGCIHFIQYPLSAAGEVWLLKQLPSPDEPLPWLLLRQAMTEMGYTGESVKPLRASGAYLQDKTGFSRDLGEFRADTNQLFEMMFMLGPIDPAHAGVLLMFFNAIPRDGEATDIMTILNRDQPADALRDRYPFLLNPDDSDDNTVAELKQFFKALHSAWSLNVRVLLDV